MKIKFKQMKLMMKSGCNNGDKNQFDADRKQFGPAASLY